MISESLKINTTLTELWLNRDEIEVNENKANNIKEKQIRNRKKKKSKKRKRNIK